MKIFTTKNLLLILVFIFSFFIIMTLLKSMNIYEGLAENETESKNKSQDKNVVVMANNG
jgi:hypothetical protein